MSSSITPFAFGDNMVRVHMDENGEPWFVAKDVARALGYSESSINQLANLFRHVPEEWAALNPIKGRSENRVVQEREVLTLSEQGLYFFLGRSDKPGALPFQKWLAGEVLPTLRRTGSYVLPAGKPRGLVCLPDALPPEALALRPALRQKLWQDALQTARLDGASSREAREWFVFLCRMVAAQPPAPTPARDKVRAFFHQCCEYAEDCRIRASVLYEAFRHWHRNQHGDLPSKKLFGMYIQEFVRHYRSNGSLYEGLRLKNS